MTQSEFDDKVLAIAEREINLAAIIADLRRQGDPLSSKLEDQGMILNNVLSALKNYDITSGILTGPQIDFLFELATITTQTYP
jgi:hypothetical protein